MVDPHKNEQKFNNWKKKGSILNCNDENRVIILKYIDDMRIGRNTTGSNKGPRSFIRLNGLKTRMPRLAKLFEEHNGKNLIKLARNDVTELFHKIDNAEILKLDGQPFKTSKNYVKDFKSFWHWYQKVEQRENNNLIEDITEDLENTKFEKPKFVYFTLDELQQLLDDANFKYKALMFFLFDTGIRAPKELSNVKVSDITNIKNSDKLQLVINDESAKTYGRTIKLMLCNDIIKRWIKREGLKTTDYLFKISPGIVNQYLKRLGKKTIGKSPTMYDFRHSSACYWLPKYKQESALKYRFGWKKSEMIHYYTEFLGMKDTIEESDLEDIDTRTELQKQLLLEKNERAILQDQLLAIQKQMQQDKEAREKDLELIKKHLYKNIDISKLKTKELKLEE